MGSHNLGSHQFQILIAEFQGLLWLELSAIAQVENNA